MAEKDNKLTEDRERKCEEICQEILGVLEGRKDVRAIRRDGALSPRLEKLIALSSVLATRQGHDIVTTSVNECLEAQATPREIVQVLEQTIRMAEVPALAYRSAVRQAIDACQNRQAPTRLTGQTSGKTPSRRRLVGPRLCSPASAGFLRSTRPRKYSL